MAPTAIGPSVWPMPKAIVIAAIAAGQAAGGIVEAHEGGGRADHGEEGDAEHQRRHRQQQRRMAEDRQAAPIALTPRMIVVGEAAAVERQHARATPRASRRR